MKNVELGGSAHADRSTRLALATWPRLLDIHLAAQYLSVGEQTIRDYVSAGILAPIELPGCILRTRTGGTVIARPQQRRIAKILIDRADLDRLIDERRAAR